MSFSTWKTPSCPPSLALGTLSSLSHHWTGQAQSQFFHFTPLYCWLLLHWFAASGNKVTIVYILPGVLAFGGGKRVPPHQGAQSE